MKKLTTVILLTTLLASCCISKITPRQAMIDYELDRAYLAYSYQRDSLIIEFYRTDVIEEDGIQWYTLDSIIKKIKPNINIIKIEKHENK